MEIDFASRLATLGHPQRLALFRLLMRRYPDLVPAGELAEALGQKPSTLSAYLSALMQAGLVVNERVGTSLRYGANIEGVRATTDYLLNDCCRGRPDICSTRSALHQKDTDHMHAPIYNVLFICTGNSARSIFAETILREAGGGRFAAYSAGTNPALELNPIAVEMLKNKGHDVSQLHAKHISEFQEEGAPVMDFVFTVCDQAANEECPPWAGQPITAHWGVPDPVKATGTLAERRLAFQHAYGILKNRISMFSVLHPENLARATLQARVDDISKIRS